MLLEKNPIDIKNMFDKISEKYDFANNLISFNTHKKVKKEAILALNIKDGMTVLDLCCGSGDLGRIIKKNYPNCNVIGLDFSPCMLEIAKKKNKDIVYYEADATNMPFADEYFDCVVVGFGLRNIQDFEGVLKEIYRVLKKNSKFLHLDFEPNGDVRKIYDKIIPYILKVFIKDISPYLYLLNSKNNFYTSEKLIEIFEDFNFGFVNYKKMLFNMIAYQIMKKY